MIKNILDVVLETRCRWVHALA